MLYRRSKFSVGFLEGLFLKSGSIASGFVADVSLNLGEIKAAIRLARLAYQLLQADIVVLHVDLFGRKVSVCADNLLGI